MDPLTAISLATNIISFIDFSWNLLTGSKELHESGRQTTKENARISHIVDDLAEFALDLAQDDPHGNQPKSRHERALSLLASECHSLSKELAAILEKLRMTSGKNSRWRSLKTTWESMRRSDEIASIESRLNRYRDQLNIRLLGLMSDRQSSFKLQLDAIQEEARSLWSSSAAELKGIREDVTSLLRVATVKDDDFSSDEEELDEERTCRFFESLGNISAELRKLEQAISVVPRETRVLQNLYFEYIFTRHDSIDDPCHGTFKWITMPDSEFREYLSNLDQEIDRAPDSPVIHYEIRPQARLMDEARRLLRQWLTYGEGIFHVSGKAGSGKSTLMKSISSDAETTHCLREWAGDKTLVVASFFFWRSDRRGLQLSLDGLYRSILFEVLRKCPRLIPEIFPHQWKLMALNPGNKSFETDFFRPQSIKHAFESLVGKQTLSRSHAFCFFIDGLDEHEAHAFDQLKFARQLREWSAESGIKMCVSSRPEIDTFHETQRIHLHDLTLRDVYKFSRNMFEKDEKFSLVENMYLGLVKVIVSNAEGVFIWACLVTQYLLVEVSRHASSERLWQTLNSAPPELDALYEQMLSKLSREDRRRADYMLLLVLTNPFPFLMNVIAFSWIMDAEKLDLPNLNTDCVYSIEIILRQKRVKGQLQSLTKGLLHMISNEQDGELYGPAFSKRVSFFHRTARDFLEVPERKVKLIGQFPRFDPLQVHSLLWVSESS
ncbi:hypothetical protein QBC34DRAFT_282585, partial [Podospora aff. communis PSN243]